jgi:hypothetical protein
MSKSPDNKYSWFLRYTNCTTKEICLRPITTGTVPEIANELLNIYCDQGAPVVLQSLNGRPFVQQVIVETNKLYPNCRQLHSEMQDIGNAEPDMILNQLYALMKRYNTDSWSSILRLLQFDINSTYRSGTDHILSKVYVPLLFRHQQHSIPIGSRPISIHGFAQFKVNGHFVRTVQFY